MLLFSLQLYFFLSLFVGGGVEKKGQGNPVACYQFLESLFLSWSFKTPQKQTVLRVSCSLYSICKILMYVCFWEGEGGTLGKKK